MIRINKKLIIPLVIMIAILAAWGFRWGKINEVTYQGSKSVYLTDRWCGQKWIITYIEPNIVNEEPELSSIKINEFENSYSGNAQIEAANKAYSELTQENSNTAYGMYNILANLTSQRHQYAVKEATKEVWDLRNHLTIIWYLLLIVTLMVSLVLYFWDKKNSMSTTPSP